MNGGVKKPVFFDGFMFPSLPTRPDDRDIVDRGDRDPIVVPAQYMEIPSLPDFLQPMPDQLLQQNLGELRKQIVDDPEGDGVGEAMESYWARVDSTTLSDVLLVESRIWQKLMEGDSPALQRLAWHAYYKIVQHDNYPVRQSELYMCSTDLLKKIEEGDLDSSKEALIIYQGFMARFFRNQPQLIVVEASRFRTMARSKIYKALSGDRAGDIDEDMISHLNNLLAVYAQIAFYGGIDLREIGDGMAWMESYMKDGHPLEQCAREVRASLEMTKDMLVGNRDSYRPVAPPVDENPGNIQEPVAGEIYTKGNGVRVGEMPPENMPKVIVQGAIQLIGSRLKPV